MRLVVGVVGTAISCQYCANNRHLLPVLHFWESVAWKLKIISLNINKILKTYHKMCPSSSCLDSTHAPTRYRKRKRAVINTTIYKALVIYLIFIAATISSYYIVANAAVWTNGPEDRFFCGIKWDDANCQSRQHCPSGRSEECEGHEDGVKCFANTNCDTRYGDGDWYVPGKPPKQSPGGTERPTFDGQSEEASDHYWCGVGLDDAKESCGTHCPSGTSSDCPQGNVCYHNV